MSAEELRDAMDELEMSQAQLAGFLRVTRGAVSRWISGERPIPGPVAVVVEMALEQKAS